MRRRDFIAGIGSAAAWPVVGLAEQRDKRVLGLLNAGSPEALANWMPFFFAGLKETGYIEGRNLVVEYRYARGNFAELPRLAAELAHLPVDVIATTGGEPAALAAKATTTTTPIVFGIGGDPVSVGLVNSINNPGGNATGVSLLTPGLGPKQLEILRQVRPSAKRIAFLINPQNPLSEFQKRAMEEARNNTDEQLLIFQTSDEEGIRGTFAALSQDRVDALIVAVDPFFLEKRHVLASLAERVKIPTIYGFRDFADAGGLMSYGTNPPYSGQAQGMLTGKVLAGANAADLPVEQAIKIELILNLKAAKPLGISFPLTLLGRADGVIE
jgi:putative tryptophan/tyrosine transport system substrate-binding protein